MPIDANIAGSPFVLRWRSSGIIVATLFGAMWAAWARPLLAHAPATVTVPAVVVIAAITGTLLLAGISVRRRGARLPDAAGNGAAIRSRIRRGFTWVVIAEVVALNLAAYLLIGNGLARYLPPAIAIIVGLHFFPLARLFRTPHYHVTGVVMTLAGVAATFAMLSGAPAVLADSLSDIACALALWGSAFATWRSVRKTSHRTASAAKTLVAT